MIDVILGVIAILILLIILWFIQPYSQLKSEFWKIDNSLIDNRINTVENFELSKIEKLPEPIQRYIKYCGLIGKPIMMSTITNHKGVDFILDEKKPKIKIDYTQLNYANNPSRLAFIDAKLYGIPFQGLDSCINGVGGMKGVIGKLITLFNQKSKEMDIAALVTVLAESIVCPSAFLQDCISWDEIDDRHVRATIANNEISVSGIYTFSREGAILSFKTKDRFEIDTNGNSVRTEWTAECNNYVEVNGIKHPTLFKGIWNRKDGDLVYFECNNISIEYRY